jgi:hypothetical protein
MVAIISEVYQNESEGNGRLVRDEDFDSMTATIRQPENDLAGMVLHRPVRAALGEPLPREVALNPDQCALPPHLLRVDAVQCSAGSEAVGSRQPASHITLT